MNYNKVHYILIQNTVLNNHVQSKSMNPNLIEMRVGHHFIL